MTVLDSSFNSVSAPPQTPVLLQEVPRLLEYRGDADPDEEFIPKTICGFGGGALLMFVCLDLAEVVLLQRNAPFHEVLNDFVTRFAFMFGITGVACSLLLVGLKVRADHCAVQLYARHWLNSISTGALYAFLIWIPWMVMQHLQQVISINRFAAAAVWMTLMAIPVLAARWVIGPHLEHTLPVTPVESETPAAA